jgi:hypothetical protein
MAIRLSVIALLISSILIPVSHAEELQDSGKVQAKCCS